MSKVIVMCGKIASGKSYYSKILSDQMNGVVLSVDDLMLHLSDFCFGEKHDDIAHRCERYLYHLAENLIKIDVNVIIDFGFWTRDERSEVRNYFNDKNIPIEIHYVKIDEGKRLEQLHNRNKILTGKKEKGCKERMYIINSELRERLDLKFEEPDRNEVDIIWNGIVNEINR